MLTLFWREILRAVLDSIRSNRIRFLLTLSGVIVGSASMVLLSGLLSGADEALASASVSASERDLIQVDGRSPPEKQKRRTTRPIDPGDVATLEASALLGDAHVVGMRTRTEQAIWQRQRKDITFMSASEASLSLFRLGLGRGRFLSEDDLRARRRVAVVGHEVWVKLFGAATSLEGLEVRAAGARFAVIGVLAKKASVDAGGPWTWDNRVLIPSTTYEIALASTANERRSLETIYVRLGAVRALAARIGAVRNVVEATLLRRHYGVRNFDVSGKDPDHGGNAGKLVMQALLMATAIVSLVVGGINLMNIMLVAITERTREIGVRRAVGAPRLLILLQFLAESSLTAAVGGLLGVLVGVGLTFLGAAIIGHFLGSFPFHIVPWAPPVALGASMTVGALFGLYPAWRASRLDPVEALRFE